MNINQHDKIKAAESLGFKVGVAPTGGYYVCYYPDGSHGTSHHIFEDGAKREMIFAYDRHIENT